MTDRDWGVRLLLWTWAVVLAASVGCARQEPSAAAGSSASAEAPASAAPAASSSLSAAAGSGVPASTASGAAAPEPRRLEGEEWPPAVVDLHVDTPWQVYLKGRDPSLPEGHITPDSVRDGHYVGITFVIYIPDHLHEKHPRVSDADEILSVIDKIVAAHEIFQLSPAPLEQPGGLAPGSEGAVTVFLSIEGAGAFAEDITQIDRFIARGVRLVGPVHAHDNRLASSATGKGPLGLTKLGKQFCQRVYAKGALVDVSHMSDAAFSELQPIAKAAGAPIIATHSNARAVRGHPRNLTDRQLGAIKDSGGVAGLNLHRSYLRRGKAKLEHAVEHVMHMVEVAGVDHVAIGTDFDGGSPSSDLSSASALPKLAEALVAKGLSKAEVRKIFSRNALRVLRWRGAGGS